MTAKAQLDRLEDICGDKSFEAKLKQSQFYPLKSGVVEIFQMNVGKKCNLSCRHCHVEAGPERTEIMSKETFEKCLSVIKNSATINTIDITGGAPEINPNLEWFIKEASKLKKRLIVRSNLVILQDPAYTKFIDIYADNKVEVCGSLPDFHKEKMDRQRGGDSFDKAIKSLQALCARGYGLEGGGLVLDLVHNPVGAYLPGAQKSIESEYRQYLKEKYNIVFNNLFCIINMPIGRYFNYLVKTDNMDEYMNGLVESFNPGAVPYIMCKSTISVAWNGKLYDCDFNQILGLGIGDPGTDSIDTIDISKLNNRNIVVHNHCYGCTAGSGSSCQGAVD